MKTSATFVLAALAASVSAQGAAVTAAISPTGAPPAGCTASGSGSYYLSVVKAGSAKAKRAPPLEITLENGILKDSSGRTGYIASNDQFQFDGPPQAGAIYTAGWSLCANSSLALGSSTIFYECFSGSFGNLYDISIASYCMPVNLDLIAASGGAPPASSAPEPPSSSAQAPASSAPAPTSAAPAPSSTPVASAISDGQPQATTPVSAPQPTVSQISDGQPQATTAVSAFTGGAPVATMAAQLFAVAAGAAALAL